MSQFKFIGVVGVGALLAGLAVQSSAVASVPADAWQASAALTAADGSSLGTVTFTGDADHTIVDIQLESVTEGLDGFHGIHIHANDDGGTCDPGADPPFSDVGGHWNPDGTTHGQHAGDLPVVFVDSNGTASSRVTLGALDGVDLIAGRAVVLHAGPDNLANIPDRYETLGSEPTVGPDEATLAAGDAGGRIGCGIIVAD